MGFSLIGAPVLRLECFNPSCFNPSILKTEPPPVTRAQSTCCCPFRLSGPPSPAVAGSFSVAWAPSRSTQASDRFGVERRPSRLAAKADQVEWRDADNSDGVSISREFSRPPLTVAARGQSGFL
jgi:hypothetical protein